MNKQQNTANNIYIAKTSTRCAMSDFLFQSGYRNATTHYNQICVLKKYLRKYNNGTNVELHTLINNFVVSGKSESYCKFVVKLLIAHNLKNLPGFVNPLKRDKFLIVNAYKNAIKLQNSSVPLYDSFGRMVDASSNFVMLHLPSEPISLTKLNTLYLVSLVMLITYLEAPISTLPTFRSGETRKLLELTLLIYLLFHTGARVSEFLNLSLRQVEELCEKKSITMMCKGGLNKFMVPNIVTKRLRSYMTQQDFSATNEMLFTQFNSKRSNRPQTRIVFTKEFNKLYRVLFKVHKPKSTGFHSFRSAFAYRSTDYEFAQKILRHKNAQTFQNYRNKYRNLDQFNY